MLSVRSPCAALLLAVLCLLLQRVEGGRMRFLSANTPYGYTAPMPSPAATSGNPSAAPYISGSPIPTYGTLPPTNAPTGTTVAPVPVSPSPTQSGYVSPNQCPGQYACAGTGGINAFNGSVIAPQCYPYGTYLNTAGQAVNITTQCYVAGNSAVSLQCPVQYDAPESHGLGVQDYVCYVYDPYRAELPWAGSTAAFAQCYNPVEYACTATNFLCPLTAPYACGRQCFSAQQYQCVVNPTNIFLSTLRPFTGPVSQAQICPAQPANPNCPTTAPAQ